MVGKQGNVIAKAAKKVARNKTRANGVVVKSATAPRKKKSAKKAAPRYMTAVLRTKDAELTVWIAKQGGGYCGDFQLEWACDNPPPSFRAVLPPADEPLETIDEAIDKLLCEAFVIVSESPGEDLEQRFQIEALCEAITDADAAVLAAGARASKPRPWKPAEVVLGQPAGAGSASIDLQHFDQALLTCKGGKRIEVDWPLAKIAEHPQNRELVRDQVDRLAELLASEGQRDAIECRIPPQILAADRNGSTVPEGHIQSLRGKHRRAAAERLGWETVRVVILADCDDTEALRRIARGDDQRKWSEIEKGRMVLAMRDAGLTLEQAAEDFGVHKGTASHWCGVAQLPACWQRLVDEGVEFKPRYGNKSDSRNLKVSASWLRPLEKFSHAPKLLENAFNEFIDSCDDSYEWPASKADCAEMIEDAVQHCSRPVESEDRPFEVWNQNYRTVKHGRLFELTPAIESSLDIVESPLKKDGKTVRVALNLKLWDKLNAPLVQKLKAGEIDGAGRKRGPGKPKKAKVKPAAEMTAAEKKAAAAAEKQKRKEQDRQLAARVKIWRERALRQQIARDMQPGDWWIRTALPAMLLHRLGDSGFTHTRARAVNFAVGVKNRDATGMKLLTALEAAIESPGDASRQQQDQIEYLALRVLIWPCVDDPGKKPAHGSQHWYGHEEPPAISETIFGLDNQMVSKLAKWTGSSLQLFWERARKCTAERVLFDQFLSLHNTAQLQDLARAAGVDITAVKKKGDMVVQIIDQHISKGLKHFRLTKGCAAGSGCG